MHHKCVQRVRVIDRSRLLVSVRVHETVLLEESLLLLEKGVCRIQCVRDRHRVVGIGRHDEAVKVQQMRVWHVAVVQEHLPHTYARTAASESEPARLGLSHAPRAPSGTYGLLW